MEKRGISVEIIEESVSNLIETLSLIYPPGMDLIGDNENLKKVLKDL